MNKILVVFDGTSSYCIPQCDLKEEKRVNGVSVSGTFDTWEEADEFCDGENEKH